MSNELVKSNTIQQFDFFNPDHFATMQRVCLMFANSELVPEIYRISEKNPKERAMANCMIAIEAAHRIGASILMVMQNMNIIYGRPSWAAKFLTATVNSCGRYKSIQYKIKSLGSAKGTIYTEYVWNEQARKKMPTQKTFDQDIDNLECIAYTSEKDSEVILESIPVTIDMAIKEGWYTKDGSKWKTMPRLMLQYRAVSFWTNAHAPEISMGMKTTEEYLDYTDIPYEDVTKQTVDKNIKENANKQTVSMDDNSGPKVNGTVKEEVNPI